MQECEAPSIEAASISSWGIDSKNCLMINTAKADGIAGTRWKPVSVLIAGLLGDGSWLEGRIKITALLLSGIPPLTTYLFFQRHIVEGVATTGLKG
jgi:ABC-type glycerol-3-phosphate transport system permease component